MTNSLFLTTQIAFVILVFSLVALLWFGLKKVLEKMNLDEDKSNSLLHYVLLTVLFWISFVGVLAYLGFFENFKTLPPLIALAMFSPIILSLLLLRSEKFTTILLHTPMSWLVYIQSFRIVMELILWMVYRAGFFPFQMTFEGWNYDIIVGLTAISAGMVFFRKNRIRPYEVIIWNVFGILLLVTIVVITTLSTPSPIRIFTNEPSSAMIGYIPFIWLPGFVVPFAFAMHFFSLKQMYLFLKERNKQ